MQHVIHKKGINIQMAHISASLGRFLLKNTTNSIVWYTLNNYTITVAKTCSRATKIYQEICKCSTSYVVRKLNISTKKKKTLYLLALLWCWGMRRFRLHYGVHSIAWRLSSPTKRAVRQYVESIIVQNKVSSIPSLPITSFRIDSTCTEEFLTHPVSKGFVSDNAW